MQVCFLFLLCLLQNPDRSVQSKGGKVGGLTQGWQRKNSTQWGRGWGCLKQHPCLGAREGVRGQSTDRVAQSSPAGKCCVSPWTKWLSVWGFSVCVCPTLLFTVSSQWCWCDSAIPSIPLSLCLAWNNDLTSFVSLLLSLAAVCIVRSVFYPYAYFVWSTLIRDT